MEGTFQSTATGRRRKMVQLYACAVPSNQIRKIETEDVIKQIRKLKKEKASGDDGIGNEAWIKATGEVIQELTNIINDVWQGQGFPEKWKKGNPQKGRKNGAQNYKGITLLNTAYKIYAMILEEKQSTEVEALNI